MKKESFKIYIDRLKDGDTEKIYEVVDSAFIDIDEDELSFPGKVMIAGQAYLAKNHLILQLKIKTTISMPCSICNEEIEVPIDIKDFSHTEELCKLKSAVYDYVDEVRNAILLKVPQFIECQNGPCPHRKDVNKYLKQPSSNPPEKVHTPFSELYP